MKHTFYSQYTFPASLNAFRDNCTKVKDGATIIPLCVHFLTYYFYCSIQRCFTPGDAYYVTCVDTRSLQQQPVYLHIFWNLFLALSNGT
jgi:hypothetical protein